MLRLNPHVELHPVFEALGYALGFAASRWERSKSGDVIDELQRWSVIAAAAVGALIGARVLGVLDEAPRVHITLGLMFSASGGKTVVGGLLGGWLAVEFVKKLVGICTRTGDLFAVPLCIGIAVGRIGCLLAGLADDTYGTPTRLPWGVDFGDGIARHPTQAYEILFLAVLAAGLHFWKKRPHANGALFRSFMTAYLAWRVAIDFLKPDPAVGGMNLIQWACAIALVGMALAGAARKYA
jgi:phosphatidylglycerol:prolipoprotein diacylglycerol transferase